MSFIVMSLQSGVIGLQRSHHYWSRLFVSILIYFSPYWINESLLSSLLASFLTHTHTNTEQSVVRGHPQQPIWRPVILSILQCTLIPVSLWMFSCPNTQCVDCACMRVSVADGVVVMQFTAWSVRKRVGRACCCVLWLKHTLSDGRSRERESH